MSETPGTAETRGRTPETAEAQGRTPPKQKARELARHLRGERPDYAYLKQVFRHLRDELEVEIPRAPKRLPHVPSEEEMRRYYQAVWQARNFGDMVLIKTLLYTGVRVSELVTIRLADVDLDRCQIRITEGKGKKDRVVPFPEGFKETLGMHMAGMREKRAAYLFESSWKKRYSDRGVVLATTLIHAHQLCGVAIRIDAQASRAGLQRRRQRGT
jgi:integrase/recombinase XerD